MSTSGYSETPLARKLGIKAGYKIKVYAEPIPYITFFADWPDGVVSITGSPEPESLDFIHVFAINSEAMETYTPKAKTALKKNGMLWVSWPKGSSGLQTDINRECVRDYLLKIGLVDVKVAAINNQWSGLKFVYRTADR